MGNAGQTWTAEAAGSGRRRPRPLSPLREHLRDTFWFTPTVGLLGAAGLAAGVLEVDRYVVGVLKADGDYGAVESLIGIADDTKTIITTVGSAMLTFIGVVFSISLVALQMASGQFSPRVVRLYVRSRITKCTFAVFLATFLFALLVQASYEGDENPRTVSTVPVFSSIVCVLLVLVSLGLFIAYVNSTLRLMRVSHVIDRITRESFRVLGRYGVPDDERPALAGAGAEVVHTGRAGVLRDVHIARLVRVARRHGVVLRLIPRIGDFVVPGTPVFAVHGGAAPPPRALRYTVSVGVERTFHQDPGFGLRQLSDIAQRALSPAVNDPTTAVQCLDRITQFLAALARRPLGALHHCDRRGAVRLVQDVPGWADLVDLGFAEIRGCATGSPQVTRRLAAALDDLWHLTPAGRRPPLERHRALLADAVTRAVPDAADREFALLPDRQGIG
ncbi:DUF2254 domain-containing protein [Streptomyces sp. NRRL B-1677]|uniref:DUF2254 domain-containing protein n=1 Tax=Streptomyces klenkii TaxID=1420899 RepID=A0A3B0AL79_9ACTN|nr:MULTISPECIES: DUF2254 domain-containing protein [Streptomyces]MBF6043701.1 DUF2254 domain-containing protein [Streptomyces sp. NRRL B-1677]RKN59676.1 DUF2254 domain-containing protein [Streptomyces klenkii]